MSNTLGKNLCVTIFGESHGECIGAVIDGLPGGIKVNDDFINECLSKRRPSLVGETSRVESDKYEIVSGVFNSYTTGTPLTILIPNSNTHSSDYDELKYTPRPSHADYVASVKYNGFQDYRGGGHFSGRITASIVASGSILLDALNKLGINISSHILSLGSVKDKCFTDFTKELDLVNNSFFPVINDVSDLMKKEMEKASDNNDSIGGIIETAITGLPVGLGEPMFDSIEGNLSKAMFAIGAVKGIEFGKGFDFASLTGSTSNDEFEIVDGKVITKTNNNGGINGGISNGMPVTFNVVIKPTPSIYKKQNSVDLNKLENKELEIKGRHDPAIVRRANIVIRCMTALVIGDFLIEKYGRDVFVKGIK